MPHDLATPAAELHTLADYIRWGASRFREAGLWFGHGTDNPVDEAMALVLHALHLDPQPPPELFAARLTRGEREAVLELFRRRIEERVPAPYLIGEAWFAGLAFHVDPRVLIPRSPVAELIRDGFEPWLAGRDPERVLDLCTGSGCIAVACALAFPTARVDASDLSPEALAVAAANVARYGLEDRLSLHRSDLFDHLPPARYSLVVSNPPYVDAAELAAMAPEFHHEPRLGLAAGEDGLDAVRRILADAPRFLTPDGLLVVEVGASRPALEAAYPDLPFQWPEFERGGEGVFVLEAAALVAPEAAGGEWHRPHP